MTYFDIGAIVFTCYAVGLISFVFGILIGARYFDLRSEDEEEKDSL